MGLRGSLLYTTAGKSFQRRQLRLRDGFFWMMTSVSSSWLTPRLWALVAAAGEGGDDKPVPGLEGEWTGRGRGPGAEAGGQAVRPVPLQLGHGHREDEEGDEAVAVITTNAAR